MVLTSSMQSKAVNGVKGTPNGNARATSVDTVESGGKPKARSRKR